MHSSNASRLPLLIAGAVTAATFLVGCASGSTSTPASSGPPQTSAMPSPTSTTTAGTGTVTVGLNQPARVGPLSYNVTAVKDLGKTLESPEGGSLSNGGFVSATVTAQNNGTAPFRLNPELFTATTSGGQSVQANFSDSIVANGNDPAFNRPISSGASVTGEVVFNFPKPPNGDIVRVTIKDPSGGTVIVNVA